MATTTKKRGASTKAASKTRSASTSRKSTTKKTTKKSTAKISPVKSASASRATVGKKSTVKQLKVWNWVLAVLALAQGVALFVIGKEALFSVTTSFTTTDALSGSQVGAQRTLYDFNMLWLVAGTLFLVALFHLLQATLLRKRYEREVSTGVNTIRWIFVALTMAAVMKTVAYVVGITDISTILLIVVACLATGCFAMIREARTSVRRAGVVAATLTALAPWLVILIYVIGTNKYGEGGLDSYVYYLLASTVVIISLFDMNMYMNNKKTGRWVDYLFTEKVYMLVNFALVSAVAWQVYFALLK